MSTMTIELPDRLLPVLGETEARALDELRMAAAVKLYEMGKLSSGAAAEVAGIPRVVFLNRLGEYGVTFHYSEEELRRDVANATRK